MLPGDSGLLAVLSEISQHLYGKLTPAASSRGYKLGDGAVTCFFTVNTAADYLCCFDLYKSKEELSERQRDKHQKALM